MKKIRHNILQSFRIPAILQNTISFAGKYLTLALLFVVLSGAQLYGQEKLKIWVTCSNVQANPGDEITYVIHYSNAGLTPAQNIQIIFFLPTDKYFTYVTSIPAGNAGATNIMWDKSKIPGLALLGAGEYQIIVKLKVGIPLPKAMYNGTAIFNPAPAAKDYTNALINGDFENDFMGWAHVSSTPTIGTSVKHGNKAAVWNNVSANYTGIMKTTKIPTGHKVYVSYWYNIPAITSGGSFYCQVMNGAGTTLGYLQPSSAVTNGWVRMSGTFTLAAADVKLYFGTSNITGTIYLDAVMIIDLSAKFADVSTKNTDWCNANITVDNIEWTTPYVVASDSFDGENSTNSMGNTETGQTWLALDGSKWGTINNKAYRVSANTAGRKYDVAVIESGLSDCAVEWVNDGQRITRYAFRVLDAANLIFLYGETSSGTYAMNKQENDVGTAIASYPLVPAAGDIIRVELSGSNIVVKVNGTQIMNINNSFNQTQTKHGLLTGNAYSGARWDNFKVEAI